MTSRLVEGLAAIDFAAARQILMKGSVSVIMNPPWGSQLGCLFRLQIGCFHHSTPFLGLLGEVLSEFGGRSNKGMGAQLRKSSLQLCVGEARIDLLVQLIDNLGARVSWSANTIPGALAS